MFGTPGTQSVKLPGHLMVATVKLPAGGEWMDSSPSWRFVRLAQGTAYWLGPKLARPLAEGEVVVARPEAQGVLRASQLCEVLAHSFGFAPDQLCGILTVAERDFFQSSAAGEPPVRFLPSTHPAAQRFAALVTDGAARDGLPHRAAALGVVAAVFVEDFAGHRLPYTRSASALHRFKEMIEKMPESEIMHHTPEVLARLCGCSERHFSRLFCQHFGVPLRAKQTELRLLKARQLLHETDAKIVQVALESGYQHLSLFNAMFKKRFGTTPSECRRKSRRKPGPLRRAAALVVAAWCSTAALRATEPSAPAMPAATNQAPAFQVKGYELLGNTLLPPSVTEPILQKHVGTNVTFETIRSALAELQMSYRDRGFVTVSVGLPQQQLTNGIVKVRVTEGRLTGINVVGNRFFSSNNVLRAVPSVRTNTILNGLVFQQELDRANANRDRQIYPLLGPGPEPGTSDLTLKVKDRLPLHGRFELNNNATPNTPLLRMNLAAQYNNLWQLDHQFGVQYSFTPEQLKPDTWSGPFYDAPLIANYSAFYRMPVGGVNGPPRPRDYTVSDFGYDEATHRFRAPAAIESGELLFFASRSSSDTDKQLQSSSLTPPQVPPAGGLQVSDQVFSDSLTINENFGARIVKPLPEFWGIRSSISAGLDFKNYRLTTLQSRVFQATIFVPEVGSEGPPFVEYPSPPTQSSRSLFSSLQYLPFAVGWDAFRPDKSGSTSINLNNSFQPADWLSGAQDFERVAGSTQANGQYYALTAGMTREQALYHGWGLRLHADGQWANQPLVSNEQYANGGLAGVRGYHEGEAYGDTGYRAQFEPHSPFLNFGLVDNTAPMLVRLYAFVDYGEVFLLDPGSRPAHQSLLGTGAGVACSIGQHFDARLLVGVPLTATPYTQAGNVRVNFGLGIQF